jgi:outer membrane protein assembly factor BamB
MATADLSAASLEKPLPAAKEGLGPRLAPAVVMVALYWLARIFVNAFFAGTFQQFLTLFWSPILLALGTLVWWLFFSRMKWADRLWGLGCLIGCGGIAWLLSHRTMVMGMFMYALPVAITAVLGWLCVTRSRPGWVSRVGLLAVALLAWHAYTLIRIDGITGSFETEWSWRWSPTAEEEYLAALPREEADTADASAVAETLVATEADWPGFRGAERDGILHGVALDRDWAMHPPKELWRRRVGPGWSSFCVIRDYAFTQEQRGEQEAVTCFEIATGREVWVHEDQARFEEVVAGAGPRSTPTFEGGKLYTLGGSGKLNCLDAVTGKTIWSRDMAADAGAKPPQWGFACSPLVTQGTVIVFAGGEGKAALAYDALTGDLRWTGGQGKHTYSSPHLWNAGGVEQALAVSDFGLEAFDPATGNVLWQHEWVLSGIFRVVQPGVADDGRLLIGTGMGNGTRLVSVRGGGSQWQATEEWTSIDMKPYFNDYIVHEGFLYGFDHDIFACIDLETGKRKWKKGRYGHGQALLVADSSLLVVVTEKGEVVLLESNPKKHAELGRFQAFEGKTWNHPVIHSDKLLVRNGEEMACYELTLDEAKTSP